ncbi:MULTISPECIES: AraC family transcriptional regulator [unclassified Parafrankia]|uniref:AraC family transcriptional regulator n=1 Tax=unclassified Parafrankia TaxID=2994368 RepID=UPI000DA5C912|nr:MULTISPECIES: AraC family transcriptional regulator [unclassified Parafrankia]TCJ40016.1 AraC family transcriptional regulator [Parafrankia sp. BMG5.11]SQD96019.1 Transcriptional regulator, AraC family [Parafrankia sp. Ea1.12]
MDVLADVLAVSGVRGALGARIEAGENWGWWAAASRGAAFHAVTAGTAWLAGPGQSARQLMPGDVVLLPSGTEHVLASDTDTLARTGAHAFDSWEWADSGAVRIGSGPVRTHILCAHYSHDPAVTTQVLTLLPDLVHIRADNAGGCLEDTVRLLGRELAHPRLGTAVVLDRLVDILLIQLLRVWLATGQARPAASWLGVLDDPVVGAAVAKLHEDPARAWTTEALAGEISVSRATLSRRFPAVVGETPGAYLTRWRMDLAARRLRDTDDTLESIARSVGYTSVYAFNRAFTRARSQPPGRYRVSARDSARGS